MIQQTTAAVESFAIGDIRVAKIVDSVEPTSPSFLYVDKRKDDLDPYLAWLQPDFVDAEKRFRLSIHSFLIETSRHRIVVDTCIGNDKQGLAFAHFNGRQAPYLRDLAARGFAPESIDYVIMTHMHLDHTGWNTERRFDAWMPTFGRARYLLSQTEWQHWQSHASPGQNAVMQQNIVPVIEAGQVDWVDGAWAIDDEVTLMPTPGHTPGHRSVHLHSRGSDAIITGDVIVHPVQIAEPGWSQHTDVDKELAIATRTQLIDRYCDTGTLILGTHFNTPTGIYIVSERGGNKRAKISRD